MNLLLILMIDISIVLEYALGQMKYGVKFYLSEERKEPQQKFEISKGSFFKLFMSLDSSEPKLYQIKGALTVSSPLRFSDQIEIDTFKERLVPIYIGLSCNEPSPLLEYKVRFEIVSEGKSIDQVDFPELTFKVNAKKQPVKINMPLKEISAGSYGIYSIDNSDVLNVDPLTIDISKDTSRSRPGTCFNSLTIPEFSNQRQLMFLKSTFSTSEFTRLEPAPGPQFGRVILTLDTCFFPSPEELVFEITNQPFANLNQKVKDDIVKSLHIGIPIGNNIPIKMDVQTTPVFLYCAIQDHLTAIDTLITKMRNMNDYIKDFNDKQQMVQAFIPVPIKQTVLFRNLNRYIKQYEVLCLIEDLNEQKDDKKSIQFIIRNENNEDADKKMQIRTYRPQPSACAIWSFESNYDSIKEFETKAITYCSQYIADNNRIKYDKINTNGCVQCELNPYYDGTIAKPQKSLCIRNSFTCPSNFKDILISFLDSMTKEIDTKDKIKDILGIETPLVEKFEIRGDNDDFDNKAIELKYKGTKDGDEFSIEAKNLLARFISCSIKKYAPISIPIEYTDEFFEKDSTVFIFKAKETKTISLLFENTHSHYTYDDCAYNVFVQCFSISNEGHYYTKEPFIGLTVLRTTQEPIEDETELKPDCSEKAFVIECIQQVNHKPMPFIIPSLFPSERIELQSYSLLSYPYQVIMFNSELERLSMQRTKLDIVTNTVYLGQLMSLINCTQANAYNKCRARKQESMLQILQSIKADFKCNTIVDDISSMSNVFPLNIDYLTLALFYLSNNPEAFVNQTYSDMTALIKCMYNYLPDWFTKINSYYLNPQLEKEANGDLIQLLITTSTNLIEAIGFFEVKGDILPNEKTNLFSNDFIITMNLDITSALRSAMTKSNIRVIEYDNIYYACFNRDDYIEKERKPESNDSKDNETNQLRQLMSEPKAIYFNDFKMKVTVYPYDLFIQNNNADFVNFVVWKHYPLLSHNTPLSSFSPNVFSLKAFETTVYFIQEMKEVSIDAYPIIRYDQSAQNETFTSGWYFSNKENKFVDDYLSSSYHNVSDGNGSYVEIRIKNIGDFTIGVSNQSSYFWLIIVSAVGGVLLLIGLSYLVYYYIKKKREKNPPIKPLLPEDTNAY